MKVTPEVLNDPALLRKFQEAQSQLSGALSRLLVTVERYPELKSNQNFLALQNQLESIENRVAVERRRFNESVRAYNTAVRSFPGSLVASSRGFREKSFFEAAPGSQAAPQSKFWCGACASGGPRAGCSRWRRLLEAVPASDGQGARRLGSRGPS